MGDYYLIPFAIVIVAFVFALWSAISDQFYDDDDY